MAFDCCKGNHHHVRLVNSPNGPYSNVLKRRERIVTEKNMAGVSPVFLRFRHDCSAGEMVRQALLGICVAGRSSPGLYWVLVFEVDGRELIMS